MDVTWEAPKNTALASSFEHTTASKSDVLEAMKEHPGQWARLSDHTTRNAANQVKRKLKDKYPAHQFRTETQDNGRVALFAIYPEPGTAEATE